MQAEMEEMTFLIQKINRGKGQGKCWRYSGTSEPFGLAEHRQ